MMDSNYDEDHLPEYDEDVWQDPEILEEGKVEARLFSDEPDPWGP